jgi:hypothetical protein
LNDLNQKFPHIKVRLFAQDNPLAILGRTTKAMRDAGVRQDEIDTYSRKRRAAAILKTCSPSQRSGYRPTEAAP